MLVTECLCFCTGLESSERGSRDSYLKCGFYNIGFTLALVSGLVADDPTGLAGVFNMLEQMIAIVRVFSLCRFRGEFGECCFGDVHVSRLANLLGFASRSCVIVLVIQNIQRLLA